jgi:serine/threonine-protein kinase
MMAGSMKAGDTLGGKYKLIQRLGKGGMGVVWEATNELTGRKVALKLIIDSTEDLRVRLRREARACGSLNHPNIVEVYDVMETPEGDPYLVMQFLPGQTLGEMLDKKRRIEPPTVAARIARDIASALDAAHGAHIIHRDLKPANIFLRQDSVTDETAFTVKVLDFGVSKFLIGEEGPATMTNMAPGTPSYMSPEQARMDKGLDHRTDIWSLGVILYEMLTGSRPFQGKTIQDVVHQIHTATIPTVLSKVRGVPPELDAIVMKCLERDLTKRMPDAKSLAKALTTLTEASASRVQVTWVAPPSSSGITAMTPAPEGVGGGAARAPASGPGDSNLQSFQARPALGSGPGGASGADALATLQYQGPGSGSLSDQRARGPLAMPGSPAMQTQVLSGDEPIPSPMSGWRVEMEQARAASRAAEEARGASSADLLVQGGTLAGSLEVAPGSGGASGREAGVTTSSATTNLIDSGGLTSSSSSRKRKRGNGAWLYVAMGVGSMSVVALAAFIVFGLSSGKHAPEDSLAGAASSASSAAPKVAVPALVATSATPAPTASPTVTTMPSAGTNVPDPPVDPPPAGTTPPESPAKSVSGTPKKKVFPPCGRFLKINCQK